MSTFNKVVPGRVYTAGITRGDNLPPIQSLATSAAHFPDFAAVTPKGDLKRKNVSLSAFRSNYGNYDDSDSPYYNPITFGISKLGSAGQSSISFKRLSNNEEVARVIWGVTIFKDVEVPIYKRTNGDTGDYVLDASGKPIKEGTETGVFVCTGTIPVNIDTQDPGSVKIFEVVSDDTTPDIPLGSAGTFYPLGEFISGVGDYYNRMYAAIGHSRNVDWSEITTFIYNNGVYPFYLKMGELSDSGQRNDATTIYGLTETLFTLYNFEDSGVKYSMFNAIGAYTGNNVNRPVASRSAPFESSYMYEDNIAKVCSILYEAEYGEGKQLPLATISTKMPKYAIMNPISLVNEEGVPYKYIVYGGNLSIDQKLVGTRFTFNHYLQATGGINPFLKKDGNYPEAPITWIPSVHGEWIIDGNSAVRPSKKQYWEMNQQLLAGYLSTYIESKDFRDYIRNRTSFIWDLGYNQEIKEILSSVTGKRKDIIVVNDATEYLVKKSAESIYSTATMLNTKAVMIPESEEYNTPACRNAINLWDARYIDEPTWSRFSLNIETMCAFARAGGSSDGKIYLESMPDKGINRNLQISHDPQMEFEDDDPAANNLINGSITVSPINENEYCRPALPTVFRDTDSVLKDLTTVWIGVVIEKILQDQWILVSGDPHMTEQGWLSTVRGNAMEEIKSRLGNVVYGYDVVTEFRDNVPNSRSIMYAKTIYYVGKSRHMLYHVLEARNEADRDNAE